MSTLHRLPPSHFFFFPFFLLLPLLYYPFSLLKFLLLLPFLLPSSFFLLPLPIPSYLPTASNPPFSLSSSPIELFLSLLSYLLFLLYSNLLYFSCDWTSDEDEGAKSSFGISFVRPEPPSPSLPFLPLRFASTRRTTIGRFGAECHNQSMKQAWCRKTQKTLFRLFPHPHCHLV